MQRLRHPIRSITEPFGKAGLTVAILALVLAMVGGAYAAGGLTKSQEKQVKKIAKKYAGKNGTNGTNGTNGAAGAKGDKGDPGNNGTSVTGVAIPTSSATCNHLGGTAYTSASGTENVCNGTTGFTKTLPKGETEKGAFAISGEVLPTEGVSFVIPLASAPAVHYINAAGKELTLTEEKTPVVCKGTAASPTAPEGVLCIYAHHEEVSTSASTNAFFFNGWKWGVIVNTEGGQGSGSVAHEVAAPFGFDITALSETATGGANGSWAVTAG